MATTQKLFVPGKDQVSTRTLLHEAVPLTGQLASGTYGGDVTSLGAEPNVKNFPHGMFQSIYDYPYLSSSANHIFDLTCGYSSNSVLSGTSDVVQQEKKINIYNQMAQILVGFNESGSVKEFDEDGDTTEGTKIREAFFLNFTRLLAKDEIKKGSFTLELATSGSPAGATNQQKGAIFKQTIKIVDYSGSDGYKINSPAGEYGILYATGSNGAGGTGASGDVFVIDPGLVDDNGYVKAGLLYYQAGIAIITASVFSTLLGPAFVAYNGAAPSGSYATTSVSSSLGVGSMTGSLTGSSISGNVDLFRRRIENISFNNTTELNSTVYFCRANHNEFNYSSNQTYVSASQFVVKTNFNDSPVSYVTTVGLYSAENDLMAVAKLSEPLKKDPSTEFTLRVRLDY